MALRDATRPGAGRGNGRRDGRSGAADLTAVVVVATATANWSQSLHSARCRRAAADSISLASPSSSAEIVSRAV
jgi:hypothetical protein